MEMKAQSHTLHTAYLMRKAYGSIALSAF